ncbi:MAG: TonB-dependent receptor [Myxococcota bacterium]
MPDSVWCAPMPLPTHFACVFLCAGLLTVINDAHAQDDGDDAALETASEEMLITASRSSVAGQMPVSGAVLTTDQIQLGRPTLELGEALGQTPGVFVANRGNFAQDSRISIRGFGARAAFGIRGIRVVLDGIPLTLPDGQSQIDSVDPGNLGRIEVLRGPAGSLYGNAAGGVLMLETAQAGRLGAEAELRTTVGSFGLWKVSGAARTRTEEMDASVYVSQTDLDGWREQSGMRQTVAQTRLAARLTPSVRLSTHMHYVRSPYADDPGALTPEDADADPQQAAEVNRDFGTGEAVSQLQAGVRLLVTPHRDHAWTLVAHGGLRTFDGAIPFRTIQFDRDFYGALSTYRWSAGGGTVRSDLTVGAEAQAQVDDRRNEGSAEGVPDGVLSLSQAEQAVNIGAFVQERLEIARRVIVLGSGRWDQVSYDLEDRLLDDGDQSGARTFEQITGQGGVRVRVMDGLEGYANASQSFETPTISELVVAAGGGLDADVDPQRALQGEGGVAFRQPMFDLDVAGFIIDLQDELIPQEDEEGRTFFTNAGRSRRRGVEASADVRPVTGVELTGAYTWMRATFESGEQEGLRTPGLPEHLGFVRVRYSRARAHVAVESELVGDIVATDANDVTADSYTLAGLRAGYTLPLRDMSSVDVVLGVRNLLNVDYVDNVRINGAGGRYFEPGPPLSVYGQITVKTGVTPP